MRSCPFIVSFSPDPARAKHLIDQACVVRPHNGQVLFEAGNAALINGDTERAWSLWRQSFAASRSQRQMVLRALLHAVPASEVCRLLSPDLDGLRAIDVMWSFRSTPEEMRDVRQQRLLAVQKQLELFESMDRVKARLFVSKPPRFKNSLATLTQPPQRLKQL